MVPDWPEFGIRGDFGRSRRVWLLREIDCLLAEIDEVLEGNSIERPVRRTTSPRNFPTGPWPDTGSRRAGKRAFLPNSPGRPNRPWLRVPWPTREVVAYHEAGHAVLARHLGIGVRELTIIPGPAYLGRVLQVVPWALRLMFKNRFLKCRLSPQAMSEPGGYGGYWQRLEDDGPSYLLGLLGGAVAEQIKFGKCIWSGSRSDLRKFHIVVQGIVRDRPGPVGKNDIRGPNRIASGSTIAAERMHYWKRAEQILTRPEVWAWVEAVAGAALERGTLTGDEIDALRPDQQDSQEVLLEGHSSG